MDGVWFGWGMKFVLLAFFSSLLVFTGAITKNLEANAIKPSQVKSKKLLIAQKKIFFKINNRESPEWSASFYENGIVEHSARPKGKYKVKGLTVFVVDVEKVKLVFESEDIKKGDIFTGDSPSSNGTLYFKVLKIEDL